MGHRRLTFVTTYNPGQSDLGGASWVDRAIIDALEKSFVVDVHQICSGGTSSVPLEIRGSKKLMARTLIRMIALREAYQTAKFRVSAEWKREIKRMKALAGSRAPDHFIVTSQWPALLLLADAGVASDLHIAHNVDTIISRSHDPYFFQWMNNSKRMESKEREILRLPRNVLAISHSDANRIRAWGIDCKHLSVAPDEFKERTPSSTVIGFIGKATWPPNAQAIRLLVDEVLPRVRERLPKARVLLCGRNSETWSDRDGVVALGKVEDLEDFYNMADLVVVPRLGESTGVSVKMLESVTYGRPVVVPTILAKDAGLKTGAMLADDLNSMVEVISSYLGRAQSNARLGTSFPSTAWEGAVSLRDLEECVVPTPLKHRIENRNQ